MELVRRYIGLNRRKGGAVSQITLEEDLNVPDQKPDIFRIIHKQGEFRADEIKGEIGKIKVRGVFFYRILYVGEGADRMPDALEGSVPVEETVFLNELEDGDGLDFSWELEDLHASAIHSRKVNMKCVLALKAEAYREQPAALVGALPEEGREEFIRSWVNRKENPYARCVYACDNDVVDHQIVNMQFENGATAHLTLTAFTKDFYRNIKVCLEKGVIEGDMRDKKLRVCRFGQEEEIIDLSDAFSDAHGGGDARLIDDVCEIMEGRKKFSDTSIGASMQSHKIAFAAEESRKSGGEVKKV